ncbi:MAG: glycoside hydrolase family 3 C-terminal domain-containing protein [Lachnospiraceae bacterium]|nr:glycoside hydrolase family 3 C-terminal domain-containing protein [Lachnospiraceae bacterium]
MKKPIVRTTISGILIVILLGLAVVANIMLPTYNNVVSSFLGDTSQPVMHYPDTYNESLDLQYSKPDYTPEELATEEKRFNEEVVGEGITLLKNDGGLPYAKGTKFSFFGAGSKTVIGNTGYDMALMFGGEADPGLTLKDSFEDRGFQVNDKLWDFYWNGAGKEYRLAMGSVSFGDAEDFAIHECPLEVLQKDQAVLDSAKDSIPVFVLSRKVGEGRDMPRSMYNHADNSSDQQRSYIEPDSKELEIIRYLNDNYDEVVLLVSASAAVELGWTEEYEHISSIIYAPNMGNNGLYALADVFSGDINPSGHTTDTFAYDASSAPAAMNYGDYQYSDASGNLTKYNYVYYQEGIYVGYRYFETRYEDVVMGRGNAGDFDYAAEVKYPFGYGLSYTTFDWTNFKADWSEDSCTVTVDVTNTGDKAGKDVVEIYAQAPYTQYDMDNGVEKSAVILTGFAKTKLLAPGETETVTVSFAKDELKSYDANSAKTYFLDDGDYYVTAGHDAHDALNNILAAKGYTTENGMTAEGDATLTSRWTNNTFDAVTYSVGENSDVKITNQFDFAKGDITYLSRSDWEKTWPTHQGEPSKQISTWGNEINGKDGKSYTYTKEISDEDLAKLDSFDSLSPVDKSEIKDTPVYGKKNGVQLVELRGLAYDDPLWDSLLDEITPDEYQAIITQSGYGNAAIDSIMKPYVMDQDAANGIASWMGNGDGYSFQSSLMLAQTWNRDMAQHLGELIANQSYIGVQVYGWYAPAMNIHRLPFSGRNGEYYSEDGYMSGAMAAASSKGAASKGMYTFIKHFALNDQENHRGDREGQFSMATFANEQTIRELYLKPFEMCIKNDRVEMNYLLPTKDGGYEMATTTVPAANALMTSFNRIGYTWAGGCYPLLTSVLRDEWGFNGFIITDNANTGLFMDAYQMIEAGGDAKLTNQPQSARWTFDKDDAASYHYAREAMHHVLYSVVNSKAMNGLMPGVKYDVPMSIATKIQIAITAVVLVLVVLLAYVITAGWKKYKKSTN